MPGYAVGSQSQFGLGENGNTFGILTGRWVQDGVSGTSRQEHLLTLLEESDGEALELVETAHLPNEQEPASIGKEGESIYGVRFVGDRVYVVSFRRIDPLYVIDIADSSAPFIAGELELPGFSDYLQPIGDGLLLGVGMASESVDGRDYFQGVKVELFDVADASALASLDAIEIGLRGTESAARHDHRSVNWMKLGDGSYRFALPVDVHEEGPVWGQAGDPTAHYGWSRTALQLLEVDTVDGTLALAGELVAASVEDGGGHDPGSYGDRARMQGEAIHYVHDGEVISGPWPE